MSRGREHRGGRGRGGQGRGQRGGRGREEQVRGRRGGGQARGQSTHKSQRGRGKSQSVMAAASPIRNQYPDPFFETLEKSLGYTFQQPSLLVNALDFRLDTEAGFTGSTEHQRFEFLGDRVVNYAVFHLLQKNKIADTHPKFSDWFMTLISNEGPLLALAKRFQFDDIPGRPKLSNVKRLADLVEALFGAMYLDVRSFDGVLRIIERLWQPFLDRLIQSHKFDEIIQTSLTKQFQSHSIAYHQTASGEDHFEQGPYLFRKIILEWGSSELEHPSYEMKQLEPRMNCYPDTGTASLQAYYGSLKTLVLEETRTIIMSGIEKINRGKGEVVQLNYLSHKISNNSDNPSQLEMHGIFYNRDEVGNSLLVLILEFPGASNERYLALADYKPTENKDREFKIKIILDLEMRGFFDRLDLKTAKQTFKAKAAVLGSVITQCRMYDVCCRQPRITLLDEIMLGKLTPSVDRGIARLPSASAETRLNPEQLQAVDEFVALPSGLQLWQGPPGTGKTTTILHCLSRLCQNNARILVCAPSNKAVQVIAERFTKANPNIATVMLGVINKLPASLRHIFLHTVSDDLKRAIDSWLVSLDQVLVSEDASKISILIEDLYDGMASAIKSQQRLAPHFYRLCPWSICESLIQKMLPAINKSSEEEKLPVLTDEISQLRLQLQAIQVQLTQRQMTSNKQLTSAFDLELLNNAQIIFCTLSVAGRQVMRTLKPIDILVVDEGGQSLEAEMLIPLALNPRKCLLVGDPQQLPALVLSEHAKERHFDWSLMWRLMHECQQPARMFTMQYRMHPEIRRWPSEKYYQGRLQDDDNIVVEAERFMQGVSPLFLGCHFFDIQGREEVENNSYKNLNEANRVIELLEYFSRQQNINVCRDVSVITFYSAQSACLRSKIRSKQNLRGMSIDTVDSFQGDENKIIIISFVRSNAGGKIGFLKSFQRLNVATTRAQYALVMLGDVKTLTGKRHDVSELVVNLQKRSLVYDEKSFKQALLPSLINQGKGMCRSFEQTGECKFGAGCRYAHEKKPANQHSEIFRSADDKFSPLCRRLGYTFNHNDLLIAAMSHRSAVEEKLFSASKYHTIELKLLGRHLLKLVLTRCLLTSNRAADPGELHRMEQSLIESEAVIDAVYEALNLQQFVVLGAGLSESTSAMKRDFVMALIGAMSIDANNFQRVESVVMKQWQPFMEQFAVKQEAQRR